MKKSVKLISLILALVFVFAFSGIIAAAAETEAPEVSAAAPAADETAAPEESSETDLVKTKAIVAGILIAVVAGAGAVCMAFAINGASKGIARQPEAAGNIRTNVMLGLVFIETAIIYALIIAILIIFVL